MQVIVNNTLFDIIRGRADEKVVSRPRVLVMAGINYLELISCFGIIYALNINGFSNQMAHVTGFYFSLITQLTIGDNNINPEKWLRCVVAAQGLINILFIVLVFGRYIASLPEIRESISNSKSYKSD